MLYVVGRRRLGGRDGEHSSDHLSADERVIPAGRSSDPMILHLISTLSELAEDQAFRALTCTATGGGARIRTGVRGFAGPCLNHSATPP